MPNPFQSSQNRLLDLCDASDLAQIQPHLASVSMEYKDALYEPYKHIDWVYFPTDGVVSLVNTMANGEAAEVGTIGNEGLVGLPVLLGDRTTPNSAYVQVPGSCRRLRASIFQNQLLHGMTFRRIMLRYAHAFFNQVALTAACNALHSVEQRCCRWFLMTHDRVQSDSFLLTQEFLGMMLGVRRTSVTDAAKKLRDRNIVAYQRGRVTVLDRPALERCSCECYAVGKNEFDRLLGPPSGPSLEKAAAR